MRKLHTSRFFRPRLEALEDRLALSGPGTPVVNAGADVTVNVGQQPNSFNMTATFTDPAATPQSYLASVFYVYGSNGQFVEDGGADVQLASHTISYSPCQLTPDTYTIVLTYTDGNTTVSGTTHLIVQPNPVPAPPVVNAGADVTVNVGQQPNSFNMTATFTDPAATPQSYLASVFYVYGSNGQFVEDGGAGVQLASHTISYSPCQLTPDTYTIVLTYTDGNTTVSGTTHLIVQPNPVPAPPVVNAGADVTVNVGQQPNSFNMTATFTDPAATPQSYLASVFYVYGSNGQFVEDGGAGVQLASHTISYSPCQLTPDTYTIVLTYTDGNTTVSGTTHLIVQPNPVPPHAPTLVAPSGGVINRGDVFAGSYLFSDPDGGPWTVRISAGDGSPAQLLTVSQPGRYSFAACYNHDSFSQPGGVYHGTISVTDATGLSANAAFTVLVRQVPPRLDVPPVQTFYTRHPRVTVREVFSFWDAGSSGAYGGQFIVHTRSGRFVESGTLSVNPAQKTLSYNLPRLTNGQYVVDLVFNDDGAAASAEYLLNVLPWWRRPHHRHG